jgi:3-dehydroquinate dehydratase
MMAENSMLDSPQKRVKAGEEFVIQPQVLQHSSLALNDPMKMQQMMYPTGN